MAERNIDIEAKLDALLELSKSTAEGTEHEAKLALEMALRLASKYGISLADFAAKQKKTAGNWYANTGDTVEVEYTDERYREAKLRSWCETAESFKWERYKRNYDKREGNIWMYRQTNRNPKLELRIFERPWGDIEFEVVRNPDPIIGQLDVWTKMGFDCIELGVTYHDFRSWLESDHHKPCK